MIKSEWQAIGPVIADRALAKRKVTTMRMVKGRTRKIAPRIEKAAAAKMVRIVAGSSSMSRDF
jgi:hypothetical protein